MSDVLRALAISGGILFPVVLFILVISIVTVKRGEATMRLAAAAGLHGAGAVAVKPAAVAPADEAFVLTVLLVGAGVFTVTVGLLLGLSLLQHMG